MRYYNSHLHPEEVNTLEISNSIILNDGVAVVADSTNGTYIANDNWWGTNDEPVDKVVNITVDSWATMDASFAPEDAQAGDEVTVTAVFSNPNLPDGIEVTFTSTSGLNTVVSTVDAQANTTYTIDVGDKEINATSGSAVIVMPIGSTIGTVLSGVDLEMSYKDGSAWTVTLTDANGNAIVGATVDVGLNIYGVDKVYSLVTDSEGVVSLPINLVSGIYAVNATFKGDDAYEASFVNATVTVNKATLVLSGSDLVMSYKDGSAWTVTVTDVDGNAVAGVAVDVGLNIFGVDKVYTLISDVSGIVSLPINLVSGTYAVNASINGPNYVAELITATVTVNKAVAVLSAEDLVMEYQDGSAWDVTLTDANGNAIANTNVNFTVKDKTYTLKTNANGVASLPINLKVGNYTLSAKIEGDSNLEDAEITKNVIVNQPDYNIVGEDVNMTYKDGTKYQVQLTDAEGNPVAKSGLIVKMTVKNVSYNISTNADGIASLPINLRAGTYAITAEYNGKQINNTIVVNKA